MKNLTIYITVLISAISLFSCTSNSHSTQIKDHMQVDSLYLKYKSMISDTNDCSACVDCAAMALAITYGIDEEITKNHEKLAKYYKEHGELPCPELLCDRERSKQVIVPN